MGDRSIMKKIPFAELLLALLNEKSLSDVPNLSYRNNGKIIKTENKFYDVEDFPSPYTSGIFDKIMKNSDDVFYGIIETNRGCPYKCVYCDWGRQAKNIRLFPMEKVKKDIESVRDRVDVLMVSMHWGIEYQTGYYNVDKRKIGSLSVTLYIDIKHVKDEQFSIIIKDKLDVVHYSYTFDDFDHMPLLYPYGAYLVILEKNETSDRYMHNIKVIGEKGLVYNMYDHFPIVVDDINLDQNMNIYATFDKYTRKFKVLMSNNKKMCVENGTTNDVTYYEFTVDYN